MAASKFCHDLYMITKKKSRRESDMYLRSNDNEPMRSNMLQELGVERIVKKVTMEENKKWEFPCFTWHNNQEWFWRWNRKWR
jgi:hypothetical protein